MTGCLAAIESMSLHVLGYLRGSNCIGKAFHDSGNVSEVTSATGATTARPVHPQLESHRAPEFKQNALNLGVVADLGGKRKAFVNQLHGIEGSTSGSSSGRNGLVDITTVSCPGCVFRQARRA